MREEPHKEYIECIVGALTDTPFEEYSLRSSASVASGLNLQDSFDTSRVGVVQSVRVEQSSILQRSIEHYCTR
jgi:hypothetical protein